MIKIVTDTTAYFNDDELKRYDIKIVPLYVKNERGQWKERIEISDDEFYERLKSGERFETSQPSPQDFIDAYKPLLDEGHEIISIHISTGLSGTVNSANAAKTLLQTDKITVIDSKSSSANLLRKVLLAYDLANKVYTREQIAEEIEKSYSRIFGFFLPMDIQYLERGGRISHFQSKISTALKLYFIVHLNEGRIDFYKLGRTRKGSTEELINIVKGLKNKFDGFEYVDTIYGANVEEGEEFRKRVEDAFGQKVTKYRIGPVLGAHLGPEFLGIGVVCKIKEVNDGESKNRN
ncbi:DegV family protein [Caldisericum exile]|uniref:DegV family protein n=1 Tax=Caldisericum exile TaxID=693075 RepID=UPI003C70A5CD